MADDVFGIVGSLQAGVFRVQRVVAEGGFGVVYQAHHEGFKAAVALKCLKIPGQLGASNQASFLAKFQEEGELLFRLSALIPAVVRPLHVGTLDAPTGAFVPFIALEWLEGESLDALVSSRKKAGKAPLDLVRVVRLLAPVARALEYAHAFPAEDGTLLSVLHRDLKPENLFVAKVHGQEAIKILDFGIGKVKTAATQIVGRLSGEQDNLSAFTPAYGAPEQWLPKRFGQTGPWTDVWGFALCAVEALTGSPPLDGDGAAIMGGCLDEKVRPTPRNLGAEVPETVEAAFTRALAVDPRDRYSNIGDFWDTIEAAVQLPTARLGGRVMSVHESGAPDAGPDLVLPAAKERAPSPQKAAARKAAARKPAPHGQALDPLSTSLLGNDVMSVQSLAAAPAARRPARARQSPGLELDMGSMRPGSGAARPQSGRTAIRAGQPEPARSAAVRQGFNIESAASVRSVAERVTPSLKWIGGAVIVGVLDFAYAIFSGEPFALGPVRAFWIAAPLAVIGLVKLVMALAEE